MQQRMGRPKKTSKRIFTLFSSARLSKSPHALGHIQTLGLLVSQNQARGMGWLLSGVHASIAYNSSTGHVSNAAPVPAQSMYWQLWLWPRIYTSNFSCSFGLGHMLTAAPAWESCGVSSGGRTASACGPSSPTAKGHVAEGQMEWLHRPDPPCGL